MLLCLVQRKFQISPNVLSFFFDNCKFIGVKSQDYGDFKKVAGSSIDGKEGSLINLRVRGYS